jgi:UDP-N-acetylglucosamine acyltransferase
VLDKDQTMNIQIHPSAFVDPAAELADGVSVGAFAVIEAGVRVGPDCLINHHAVLQSGVSLGSRNQVSPYCILGGPPQDLGYRGEPTRLEIGDDNQFREFTSLHRGTPAGGGLTRVGSHNLIMANAHVAHDCRVGDNVVIANAVSLAGHCQVGDHAVIGGITGLHQHARIGTGAMVGALSRLSKDVPPFSTTAGCDQVKVYGINKVGLRRRGIAQEALRALEHAYRVFQDVRLNFSQALQALEELAPTADQVRVLIEFIKNSERGVYR